MSDSVEDANEANPSDSAVEGSIKDQKHNQDRRKYSIVPPALENDGLDPNNEVSTDMESSDHYPEQGDFEQLSSDKEEDTTEGEITDIHTSD